MRISHSSYFATNSDFFPGCSMYTHEVGLFVLHAPPIASLEGTNMYAISLSSHNKGKWESTSMGDISAAMITILN